MFKRIVGISGLLLALLAFACGGGDNDSTPTLGGGTPSPNLPAADSVFIFGSPADANSALDQLLAADGPGLLYGNGSTRSDDTFAGIEVPDGATYFGTTLSSPVSADFIANYEATYGEAPPAVPGIAEAYDAVYVGALAAVAANSNNTVQVREHIHYVANSPGELVGFGSEAFGLARETLEANGDVNYIGASGQVDLTVDGEISKAQLEVWRLFGDQLVGQEARDVDLAAEIGADVPAGALNRAAETPSDPLRIGAIISGDNAAALESAMQLAVDEINASGGVFGSDVELLIEDDAGDAAQAVSAAESLAGEGVSVIIGPVSEESSQSVADEFANPTSAAVFTLSAAPALPIEASEGFLRVVSTGLLETPVLANLALEAEAGVACVLHGANADDLALAEAFKAAFEHKEGGVRPLTEVSEDMDLAACLGT